VLHRAILQDVRMFACPATAPYSAPAADRPRYVLHVRLPRRGQEVSGELSVRFTPNRPTDRLLFRLWANERVSRQTGARLGVTDVTSAGKRLQTSRPDATTLVVRPPRPLRAGSSVDARMRWRLVVPPGGDRIGSFRGGVRLGSFFPLLAWDPRRGWVSDQAARIPGESSTSPVADFDVHVEAPPGTGVVASGVHVGVGHWRATAVRDFALESGRMRFAVGTAHAPNPVRVHVALPAPSHAAPQHFLRLAVSSLETLSRMYGPYPWTTYSVAVMPGFGLIGIEYPNVVFVGRSYLDAPVVQHETAHQWFYSLVGNDQARDPWLDETLATWAEERIGLRRPGPVPRVAATHVGAPLRYWNGRAGLYFIAAYEAGARALASLGARSGVDCALKLYAARNAYRIAQPGDLDALNRVFPGSEGRLRRFGIHR